MPSDKKKRLSFLVLFLYITALAGTAGCRIVTPQAHAADYVDTRLVQANTSFAFDLFQELRREATSENIFISPASISLALAMTYNGAAGDTAEAMADVLGFSGLSLEELNTAFKDLNSILNNPDPKVQLAVANSLWAREGVDFYEEFLQRNRDYYEAEVAALDFDKPDAADKINRWVEQKTNDKIKDLVTPPIDPATVMFLINAIYFKADWQEPFDPARTREIPFTLPDGSVKEHPVMFREGEFRYLDGDGFQAVSLPYGKNGRISMYVFLPDAERSLDNFAEQLSATEWGNWMQAFTETEGILGLPRFSFEYEASLNTALMSLGMDIAFNPSAADFSAMRAIPPNLYIAEVKHKSFVEVNEKGTEAAAATSVEMQVASAPLDYFYMTVDRPFYFSIVDDKTGSILFMGSVNEPL